MIDHEQEVAELFAAALDLAPDERGAFLAGACTGHPSLLTEVRALLAADEQVAADGFMQGSALKIEAQQFAHELAETRAGQRFDHYKLLSLLGEGGMGEVYLAEDTELGRRVALKLVKSGMKTKEILRRFHNERQILANLQHQNIARLLDGGTTEDGLPFFVMEYVAGQPIDEYADEQQLSTTARLDLFRTVCSAVSYAHQHLVIHRDLKPSNILVTADGTPKLLDFGIAKLFDPAQAAAAPDATATLLRVMTPEYASPEQVKGESITTASDVYTLGVLLYELLTGQRPYRFKSSRPDDVASAVCTEQPERPSNVIGRGEGMAATDGAAPSAITAESVRRTRDSDPKRLRRCLRGDLDNIILTALRKEPARRYASVGEFSEDIRRHLEGLPVTARKDTFTYRASKFVRRNKIAAAAAAIVSLTLIGGIIATAWEARAARAERAQAERRFNDVRQLAHSVLFDYHDAIANLPGSTPVRERLVRDAIEYLNRLSQQAGKDTALRRELASAYLKVGDVLGRPYRPNLGHTDAAMENYLKARSIFDELVKADPTDYASRRDLSVAYEDIGLIQARAYEWTQAVESQRQALTIREALTANDPNNQDFRSLLGDSYFNFADAMMFSAIRYGRERANVNDRIALENYRKSLSIRETLSEREPTNRVIRRDVAQSYQRIGIAMLAISDSNAPLDGTPIPPEDFRQIIESHNKSLALRETLLASEPLSAQARRDLADEYVMRGDAQVRGGDFAGALKGYQQSLPILESLLTADPTNAEARSELAFAYLSISVPLEKLNDEAGALENYRRSLRIFDAMFKDDPSNEENWKNLISGYTKISVLLAVRGHAGEVLSEARRTLSLIESRPIADSSSPEIDTYMAHQYEYIGDNYSAIALHGKISSTKREEDLRVALMWYQKSLNILLDMKSRGTLSSADAGEPDEVSREIAKCDAALSK